MSATGGGPRPEVLARLAEGIPSGGGQRVRSASARAFGLVLCGVTAAVVVLAVIVAGAP